MCGYLLSLELARNDYTPKKDARAASDVHQ